MPVTRRALVESSLAASALAVGARGAAPSDRLRIGLIGCGGISVADSNAFLAHPECEIAAVCDVDDAQIRKTLDRLEKLGRPRPDAVKDFRRILDRSDVQVCLICTPDHWHALPAIAACQAGKDVYVEKPLATSIGEGRRMRDAAREYARVCQMGTHWRSGEHYREAVDLVCSGKLGKVRQVRCWAYLDWIRDIGNPPDGPVPPGVDYDLWLGPAPARPFNKNRFHFNFRWFWDYAGGLMTDWGVHLINIALWAMGPGWPRSVFSSGGKYALQDNSETPDTQITVYEFPSYTLIWEHQVQCGLGPDRREHGVMFTGSEASLIVDTSGWEVIAEPAKRGMVEMKRRARTDEGVRAAHARNFLDCVRSRQAPVENLDIGHHVSAVAHLGNLALRSRSRIDWDAAAERVTNSEAANGLVTRAYRAPWKLG
ncbi:MAG TPA: Gfo/Idh/MocA family oxidoreductase [Bryobacteraceae bacterium]|nr:Gfo/Idh/MocA family oxidoreductase [Bryobacteraceae bacterium]